MKWLNRTLITGAYLTLCLSSKDFRKALKHFKIEEVPVWVNTGADGTTHFLQHSDGKLAAVVCLRNNKQASPLAIQGLLVHEAVHVFQQFCQSIGEHAPSTEFEAYSIQTIYQTLAKAYQELTTGGKK